MTDTRSSSFRSSSSRGIAHSNRRQPGFDPPEREQRREDLSLDEAERDGAEVAAVAGDGHVVSHEPAEAVGDLHVRCESLLLLAQG